MTSTVPTEDSTNQPKPKVITCFKRHFYTDECVNNLNILHVWNEVRMLINSV